MQIQNTQRTKQWPRVKSLQGNITFQIVRKKKEDNSLKAARENSLSTNRRLLTIDGLVYHPIENC